MPGLRLASNIMILWTTCNGAVDSHTKHAHNLSMSFRSGRSNIERAVENLVSLIGMESKLKLFSKHVAIARTLGKSLAPFALRPGASVAQAVGG